MEVLMPYVIHVDINETSSRDLMRIEKLVAEDHELEQQRKRALERIAAALEVVTRYLRDAKKI